MQNYKITSYRKWKIAAISLSVAAIFITVLFSNSNFLSDTKLTPAGLKSNTSIYLTMRDGVRIAIDIWLPSDLSTNDRIPTLIRATRYGRAYNTSKLYRLLAAAGFYRTDVNLSKDIRVFNDKGYAVVKIDARGSGASFGSRQIECSSD